MGGAFLLLVCKMIKQHCYQIIQQMYHRSCSKRRSVLFPRPEITISQANARNVHEGHVLI